MAIHCYSVFSLKDTQAIPLTKGSAANYVAGFTNVLAIKNNNETPGEVMAPLHVLLLVYCRILGALDFKIVAATGRNIAKLSSEAGGSEKFENSWRLPYGIVATTKSDRYA